MSNYLQHYVDWGLSQIVFVSSREKEVESGYNLEITWETVVARKGQGFVEVVAQERVSFAPGAGSRSVGKDSERLIAAEEYRKTAQGKPILDTPEALARLQKAKDAVAAGYARQEELRALRAPLYKKLDELTPKCPDCERKMVQRKSRSGAFWGCPTYPQCDGTRSMTAEVRRILTEIADT
ncbi:MAG: topoisomerase DNA-binding C4 zinc finger domain-containing protein [Acidobacteriia bacterium]|nr:topoisomerase DNA-binding C4 zinc finger domain-containing protein [Terriglobia bacterium]